jgi:drug/metabolite transporter (DMT)-like permease
VPATACGFDSQLGHFVVITHSGTTDAAARDRAGALYTLLAALGFAAVSTLTTLAMRRGASLSNVLMWRYAFASVAMLGFIDVRSYRMPWREARKFLVLGGGGEALLVGLALSSLQWVSVATLAFLFYTYPVWVTLVQTIRNAEALTARRALAVLLSFGGTAVISGGPGGAAKWQGVALALGAAMVYGAYIPLLQALQKTHPIPVTSALSKVGSAMFFLLAAVATRSFEYAMPGEVWSAIVALALFGTVLPGVLFLAGLMRLGPVRAAILSPVEPFLTAMIGAIVLRQSITPSVFAGGAMILMAVAMLQFRSERVA